MRMSANGRRRTICYRLPIFAIVLTNVVMNLPQIINNNGYCAALALGRPGALSTRQVVE